MPILSGMIPSVESSDFLEIRARSLIKSQVSTLMINSKSGNHGFKRNLLFLIKFRHCRGRRLKNAGTPRQTEYGIRQNLQNRSESGDARIIRSRYSDQSRKSIFGWFVQILVTGSGEAVPLVRQLKLINVDWALQKEPLNKHCHVNPSTKSPWPGGR